MRPAGTMRLCSIKDSSLWSPRQLMWGVTFWVLSEEDVAVMAVLRDVVDRMQVRSRPLVTHGATNKHACIVTGVS
jgi:hypothetical protein